MTVAWSAWAQALTTRPMKGMLTGPVTVQKWSFVRDDQPLAETTLQLAPALRDEVRDLEAAACIPVGRLWVNPDCGSKTRDWPETRAALAKMVQAARAARARLG